MWKKIKRGEEGIPYGSMVAGEEDEGGDMNVLHHDYKWTQHRIIHTYNDLGDACLLALVVIYLTFRARHRPLAGAVVGAVAGGSLSRFTPRYAGG